MSALDTFKRLVTFQPGPLNAVTSIKSISEMPDIFGPNGQRSADWSGVAENPALSRSYRLCATAYACMTFLADAVSEAPLRVYRIVAGELIEQPEHRLRRLMVNPNPVMSEAEFIGVTVMSMGMFGYAVVEKVRSGGGVPVELWPVRPDWLKRERSNDGTSESVNASRSWLSVTDAFRPWPRPRPNRPMRRSKTACVTTVPTASIASAPAATTATYDTNSRVRSRGGAPNTTITPAPGTCNRHHGPCR